LDIDLCPTYNETATKLDKLRILPNKQSLLHRRGECRALFADFEGVQSQQLGD
jgi:hypothetical protein